MSQPTPQVLVVEPDATRQRALAVWLESAGYDCVPVSDPDEALAIAEDDEADVALVSGPTASWSAPHLALALQSRAEDLPVIVVRGAGEPHRRRLRGGAGALEEIPAPLTRGSVMHAIVRALEWRDASPAERAHYLELERAVAGQVSLVRDACLAEPCATADVTACLVRFLDRRVPGAAGHAARVSAIARELGASIGMPGESVPTLTQAAWLHDFGQALMPQALRRSPLTLGRLERVLVGRHPDMVFELLSQVPALKDVASLVRCAHERFDGTGFPRGLSGLEIPMGARVIALARAIDVAQSGRHPCRPVRRRRRLGARAPRRPRARPRSGASLAWRLRPRGRRPCALIGTPLFGAHTP